MNTVLPPVALHSSTRSAFPTRLESYLKLHTGGFTVCVLHWAWSKHSIFLSLQLLCSLKLVQWSYAAQFISHFVYRPQCLCSGKAACRWLVGVFTVFICLAQLKSFPRLKICVAEWTRTIWLKGKKQCLNWQLQFTLICILSMVVLNLHWVVKITAWDTGESQLGVL